MEQFSSFFHLLLNQTIVQLICSYFLSSVCFFPISKSNNYDTSEVINVSRVSVVREEGRKEGGGL